MTFLPSSPNEEFILTAKELVSTNSRGENLTEFEIGATLESSSPLPLFHSPHALLGLLSLGCIALQIILGKNKVSQHHTWSTSFLCRAPTLDLPLFWEGSLLLPPSSYFFWPCTFYQVQLLANTCSRFLLNLFEIFSSTQHDLHCFAWRWTWKRDQVSFIIIICQLNWFHVDIVQREWGEWRADMGPTTRYLYCSLSNELQYRAFVYIRGEGG